VLDKQVLPSSPLKLHLCCGDKRLPGFIGVDIRAEVSPDIIASVEDLSIFSTASASEIYFCHGPEHLSHNQIGSCLCEIRRILMPGGTLRLAMPDFDRLVNLYVDKIVSFQDIHPALYGGQEYPENVHFSGHNMQSISQLLTKSGFVKIERYDAKSFLPVDYFDWSLHRLKGVQTSLNVKCIVPV
jgi:predicted SAM-dependent methyltransferase